ncbi:MAG: glycine cleavage system aminomethyltransferase GcvT [Acidobacteria bacterium]|nr:glycine cleavage system aminomethyltransferase GcvT [Acidobacteriota bacterium]
MNQTPLHPCYAPLPGARMVDFAGWRLPLHFEGGILAEHRAVRGAAGLFDVSHMGRIRLRGPHAAAYVDWLATNSLPEAGSSGCRYSLLCAEDGGCIDDIVVCRPGEQSLDLTVNAASRARVLEWITGPNPWTRSGRALPAIEDVTSRTAQLALQGPASLEILAARCDADLAGLRNYHFLPGIRVAGIPALVSRTGYTGEDGFELFVDAPDAPALWRALLEAGAPLGLVPCGLGARDTLRFEAGMPLYGQELGLGINPLEAGLGRFVDLAKGDFSGKRALEAVARDGAARKRIGLEMIDAAVARTGHAVRRGEEEIGRITSGGKCPTVGIFGAMALVRRDAAEEPEYEIDIRGRWKRAGARPLPFYRRGTGPRTDEAAVSARGKGRRP